MSQEELCAGICSTSTICRIESGKQNPRAKTVDMLMKRLGASVDMYFYLLSEADFQVENLKQEIVACDSKKDVKENIYKMYTKEDFYTDIFQQLIPRSKLIVEVIERGEVQPNDCEEAINKLTEAIQITVPEFDLNNIENGLFVFDEIKIINSIAILYFEIGKKEKAMEIYRQLWNYTNKHYVAVYKTSKTATIIALVAYYYSKHLGLEKRYKKSLEIAEIGREYCINYDTGWYLGQLLCNIAFVLYQLDRKDESKEIFLQSYYFLSAMQNEADCAAVKVFIDDHFDVKLY